MKREIKFRGKTKEHTWDRLMRTEQKAILKEKYPDYDARHITIQFTDVGNMGYCMEPENSNKE